MSELEDDKPLQPWVRAALLAEGLEPGPSVEQRSRMAGKLALAVGVPVAALVGAAALTGSAVVGAVGVSAGAAASTTAGAGTAAGTAASAGAGTGTAAGTAASAGASAGAGTAVAAGGGTAAGASTVAGGATAITTKAIAIVALLVGGAAGVTITELRHRSDSSHSPDATSVPASHASRDATTPDDASDATNGAPDAASSGANAAPIDAPAATDTGAHHAHVTASHPDAGTHAAADDLSRERELIDVARSALRAGDTRLATKNLVEHELRFPSGKLTEERRALAIEVAIAKGDRPQAARLAADFRRDFPNSVFQKRIDELLK